MCSASSLMKKKKNKKKGGRRDHRRAVRSRGAQEEAAGRENPSRFGCFSRHADQELLFCSDPNPPYFLKSTAVQMGGILPYKWEAYAVQMGGVFLGFPFFKA